MKRLTVGLQSFDLLQCPNDHVNKIQVVDKQLILMTNCSIPWSDDNHLQLSLPGFQIKIKSMGKRAGKTASCLCKTPNLQTFFTHLQACAPMLSSLSFLYPLPWSSCTLYSTCTHIVPSFLALPAITTCPLSLSFLSLCSVSQYSLPRLVCSLCWAYSYQVNRCFTHPGSLSGWVKH